MLLAFYTKNASEKIYKRIKIVISLASNENRKQI